MKELDPIKTISAASASKIAGSVWLNVFGLPRVMLQLLYFALDKDPNDPEANLMLVQLSDELMDPAECIVLNDYVAGKNISDQKRSERIKEEIMRRFYRQYLAKHVSGSDDFPVNEFLDPSRFVIDEKQVANLREQTVKQGWTGPLLFDSAVRLIGHRAGLLKHYAKETPAFEEFRHGEHFAYTDEWEKFLNTRELYIDYPHS